MSPKTQKLMESKHIKKQEFDPPQPHLCSENSMPKMCRQNSLVFSKSSSFLTDRVAPVDLPQLIAVSALGHIVSSPEN